MTRAKRIRLDLVMRAARFLKVPICPHQEFLAEDRPPEACEGIGVTDEHTGERGRVFDLALRRKGVIGTIDH